jgi:hypothetical protein
MLWQYIFFIAITSEFTLVPWIAVGLFASQKTPEVVLEEYYYVEMVIDLIWALTIMLTFITAFKIDIETNFKVHKIAANYVFKGMFLFDILSTVPFFVFNNLSVHWYLLKAIRFIRIGTFRSTLFESFVLL